MTDFLLFAGSLLLASLLFGRSKPAFLWVIAAILVAVAGKAFAAWSGSGAIGLLAGTLGIAGPVTAVAKILLLFFFLLAVFGVLDRKLDKRDALALFIIPTLLLIVGGPLASALNAGYDALRAGVVTAFTAI